MSRVVEFDVALSFAGEDRAYVDQVATLLKEAGVRVFYDLFEEANLWGKNLYDYLSEIYKNKATYTIMFISQHYLKKLWTNHERTAMQSRAFVESQEYILPARFDATEIPGVLPTVGYISLTRKTPAEFVEIIKQKLVSNGFTVPSAAIRGMSNSISRVRRVDPIVSRVTVTSDGSSVPNATVVAIADNNTILETVTDDNGVGTFSVLTRRNYHILVAHPNFGGTLTQVWDPINDIDVVLYAVDNVGSVICKSTCYIPDFQGRLNVVLDAEHRTYLYAENISINDGKLQPVYFSIEELIHLEDCNGLKVDIRVLHIKGTTSLLEFVKN